MINPGMGSHHFFDDKYIKTSQRAGFKKYRVVTVPKGTLLFRMTAGVAAAGDDGGVTPWWSAVKPFLDDKEGALGRFQQAKSRKMDMSAMVRLMSCVCLDWNDLDNYVQVELLDDARVFWGTFAPMPKFSQTIYTPGWGDDKNTFTGANVLARVKKMNQKEALAGFKVPNMLGEGEAWQMFIPNLREQHIKRSSVLSGHDMGVLAQALGLVDRPA
ncbi:hypothetical protein NS226_09475 [Aureimonas ureilytica]|uniref:Uncharacterized protein n=1 Tax=Aureimonas ureilytica TaxID=401562 RepID=A0A175RA00_9HYPH|nr:hypothetical protein [Aureimonas ureilytica]KTQ95900.1 hypothetical protein NS226_09475 [Aureimonas ureilytica]